MENSLVVLFPLVGGGRRLLAAAQRLAAAPQQQQGQQQRRDRRRQHVQQQQLVHRQEHVGRLQVVPAVLDHVLDGEHGGLGGLQRLGAEDAGQLARGLLVPGREEGCVSAGGRRQGRRLTVEAPSLLTWGSAGSPSARPPRTRG